MMGTPTGVGRATWSNPVAAVATVAARNPRGAVLLGGTSLAALGMALLLAVASIQAFLVLSGGSAIGTRTRLSLLAEEAAANGAAAGGEIAAGALAGPAAGVAGVAAPGSVGSTSATGHPTAPVTADEIVAVHGIRVHTSIAADVRALIEAARADGVPLSGWGWRDTQTQIRLRREHCGTSEFAIYRMPSSRCRPPTARPGSSQHERGLAIDFTYGGRSISTRRSLGFVWLNEHAAAYGLKNLASEPWHWSTTGR